MRYAITGLATMGLFASPVLLAQEEKPLAATEIAEAGAKYQKNCMGCHAPPDRRFASDRAWIGQIQETS